MKKIKNPLPVRRYEDLRDHERIKNTLKDIIVKEQYPNEKDFIIQNENFIENINIFTFYKRLKNFDTKKFFDINREQFYTPENVDFFNYFTKAILYSSKKNYRLFRRVRYWLEDLEAISKGSYGSTYSARVKGADASQRLFLLKFDKKENNKEISLHEYFIGNFFMNKLRKICPNFSMVFGLLKCSLPESVFGFGREYKKISCLVYEYINPATTFAKFIIEPICTPKIFLSIFLQIVFALTIASKKVGFTHNDLHSSNIMVKELDKETLIPYEILDKKVYVITKYIAVIIDYGLARVEIESKNFGPYGIPHYSLLSYTKCYPIKDVFALLLDSCRVLFGFSKNKDTFNLTHKIMKGFFVSGIRSGRRYDRLVVKGWHYPFIRQLEGYSGVENFITWLFSNFKNEVKEVVKTKTEVLKLKLSNFDVFDCEITGCLTLEEIYDQIYKKKPIEDIFYYYDLFQYNVNVKAPKAVLSKTLKRIFSSFLSLQKYITLVEEDVRNLSDSIEPNAYRKVIKLYIEFRDINEMIKVLKVFTDIDEQLIREVNEFKVRINAILKVLNKKKISAFSEEKKDLVKDFVIPSYFL